MDKFLLVILVILGQFLIPTSTNTYRVNYNAVKIKPKSPQIVLVKVWDLNFSYFHENRNGFIVNKNMILTWVSITMSPAEVLWVHEYKYSRSMDDEDNGWKVEDQLIGVKNVKRHPCLPELALIELERPLEFEQNFQPLWFHADYQNEMGQNVVESWIEGWSLDKLNHEMFFDFQRTKVKPILKSSIKNLNQTQNYYTTTYAYSSYEAKIGKFGEDNKNKDEATGQCLFPCFFPGAGLLVREKGQNKSYLAGIAYPDPNHKIFTHIDSDKCQLNLKFLDVIKMLCWISGSTEFSQNCSNPEGYEDNCQISDINKNQKTFETYEPKEESIELEKNYFEYLTVQNIVLFLIFILFCILIFMTFI